ncbi:FKBP-type peptidyl-prolyl cis-trans isomerase [Pseudoalteromonas fenneropenaei]|uniref:Peptidyl-prolyl cis-trans isomerase n=1 Tax=Pseudoalteromonas fenneropenaei TaxID=1737459 RepID=A0ABV7CMT6_9GAMM
MSEQVIGANSQVIFHFSIKLADGSAADSTKVHNKPAKLVMGDGSLTENFEKCLFGLAAGDSKSFELAPQDAFGMPNPDNIYYVERSKFSVDVPPQVGAIIAFTQPDGTELPGVIRDVAGDSVTVDFNHPLAGQRITFEVDILEVRN